MSVPTLLHCAALNNHMNVAEWLKQKAYPPTAKLKRELDQDEHVSTRNVYILGFRAEEDGASTCSHVHYVNKCAWYVIRVYSRTCQSSRRDV